MHRPHGHRHRSPRRPFRRAQCESGRTPLALVRIPRPTSTFLGESLRHRHLKRPATADVSTIGMPSASALATSRFVCPHIRSRTCQNCTFGRHKHRDPPQTSADWAGGFGPPTIVAPWPRHPDRLAPSGRVLQLRPFHIQRRHHLHRLGVN